MAGGRPSKYKTHVEPKLDIIKGWCRNGLTMEDIAHNLGISAKALYEYKRDYSEFSDALKYSREEADLKVENALFKSAMGYEYIEETEEMTSEGMKVTKRVTKQVNPSNTAQIFWLKNRRPDLWRDKREVETSGETTINNKVDLKAVSTEDLKKLLEVE